MAMLHGFPFRHSLFLIALLAPLAAARAEPLPAEAFAALPEIDNPRLSPDGRSVAMISPRNGRLALRVWRNDDTVEWFSPAEYEQINWVAWKGSDRLLYSVRATEQEAGRTTGVSRLLFVGLDDRKTVRVQFREAVPMAHIRVINREPYRPPNVQDRIISLLPDDPEHILMAAAREDFSHPEAMTVDVHQGSPRLAIRSSGTVIKWLADQSGTVRLKTILEGGEEGGSTLSYEVRDGEKEAWRPLHRSELDHDGRFVPLAFSSRSASTLFVLADGTDGRLALREMDSGSRVLGPILAADALCDVEPAMSDQMLTGYSLPCRDQAETYFDAGWQKDQAVLQRALKTPLVTIIDRSPDGLYALVKSTASASAPASFWYFNQLGGQKLLMHLGDAYTGVPPDRVANSREVSLTARDGTALPAFLTVPGEPAAGPLPFVVLPHGGPTAHDTAQFDWIVQFLVSRGYGVLQPQFRGSTGYGAAFQRAGYQQWGRLMQDDVTDATRWLVAQKQADPKRICIAGSSYGGYAALIGAAQHADLYRCAVAIAPVTDIDKLLHDRDHAEFGDIHHSRVAGDLESETIPAPLDYARTLSMPVLLIHGKRDFTVPAAHSEQMADRLKDAGHAPTLLMLGNSDHFFSDAGDRLKMLKAMEQFLGANLAGDLARRN